MDALTLYEMKQLVKAIVARLNIYDGDCSACTRFVPALTPITPPCDLTAAIATGSQQSDSPRHSK